MRRKPFLICASGTTRELVCQTPRNLGPEVKGYDPIRAHGVIPLVCLEYNAASKHTDNCKICVVSDLHPD